MPNDVSPRTESAPLTEVNENKWLTPAASGQLFNEVGKGMNTMGNANDLANRTNTLVENKILPGMSIHNENPAAPGDKVIVHFGGGKIQVEMEIGKPLEGKPNPDAKPGEGFKGIHEGDGPKFRPGLSNDLKDAKPTSGICDNTALKYSELCIVDTLLNG